jgi:hypothetical protein
MCAAPKGNQFWKARSSHGANPKFANAEDLWSACQEYFDWVEKHPLLEEKIFHTNGVITKDTVAKMRAMTIGGLCIFLDITQASWFDWAKTRKDLIEVITRTEAIIRNQKFAGAAADLLNPNIIARDLGLADKTDHKHSGSIGITEMPDEELLLIASGKGVKE